VNFERKVIVVQSDPTFKTKTGRLRVVPLADGAVNILWKKKFGASSKYVFTFEGHPFKGDHVIRNHRKAVIRAGLSPKLNFHSLRLTHASWLVQAGVSIYQVSKILGHSSVEVTQKHYASLEASELHGAVNRISLDVTDVKNDRTSP
jgi:integrase